MKKLILLLALMLFIGCSEDKDKVCSYYNTYEWYKTVSGESLGDPKPYKTWLCDDEVKAFNFAHIVSTKNGTQHWRRIISKVD